MGLKLYLDLLSQPCRAVYLFAKKKGIPFQLCTVDLLKGQHMNKEFLPVNSLQKVPVLEDKDFLLTERPTELSIGKGIALCRKNYQQKAETLEG